MKKGVLYTFGASIILIICFIAFVLPTSLSKAAEQQEALVFGKYNGRKISYEYGSDFTNFLSQYAEMYRNNGQEITQSNQFTLYSYAFNSTVFKYAQEYALKAAGYEVPQESINRKVKEYFTDETGKFSKKAYLQADSSFISQLTDSITDSLYTGRYYEDYYGSSSTFGGYNLFGIHNSEAEEDFLDTFKTDHRSFKMARFSTKEYPREEQEKFGKANSQKFVKYDMSVITVETKEIADKVTSRISKGQITFEDAIAEYSDKNYSDSDGKLSNNSQYQIENLLEDKDAISKITDLAVGEVSPALQTTIGYSIFKCDGAATQPDLTSDDTLSDVLNYITIYEATVVEDYYTEIAKNFTKEAKQSDMETAALNYENAVISDVESVPLNYGSVSLFDIMDTDVDGLSSADTNEDFLTKAFSLKLNEYSEPIVLNGDIAVLQYTQAVARETSEEEEQSSYSILLSQIDENSSQSVVFQDPKLENDFIAVYMDNFLSSSF